MPLPYFYPDNVNLDHSDTDMVNGNVVYDCEGGTVIGIHITNCVNVRAKDNKVLRMRSISGTTTGFLVEDCTNVLFVYNVASRCTNSFRFLGNTVLNVYNLTSHNASTHVYTNTNGLFRNIDFSSYIDHTTYQNCIGFGAPPGVTVNVDYMYYHGVSDLYSGGGTINEGTTVEEIKPLYMDEANDDLTPDHISPTVNSGTPNPLVATACIGGIESEVVSEVTADRKYHYELLDNSFWDIESDAAAEVAFIKAFQSRILANSEVAEHAVERDYYIKTATSMIGFSELFPIHTSYANPTKFKKRVMDMWYGTQNVGTLQAYNNSIGGYNVYPSFFKRLEDVTDAWIIAESDVAVNNWLMGMEGLKYGIVIDVLGLSTLTQAASGECYNNVMSSVGDIAPVYWDLHDEPQPTNYLLFTDLYNDFEECRLTNMEYNDDYNISIHAVQEDGAILTPLISTTGIAATGNVEISVLDRVYSEIITRRIYYRQGESAATMGDWAELITPIGGIIALAGSYIQFRVTVTEVLRIIDYEFLGLCLRPYTSARNWTQDQSP